MQWLPFWPREAAVGAGRVDTIFLGELVLVVIVLFCVIGTMILFSVRYRHNSDADRSHLVKKTWHWEIAWTGATLVAFLVLFVWGANAYVYLFTPPADGLEIYVVGKQWMWKIEHPGGQREIDALHVPVGRTVRLVLASQDVIHSFFVPAFRIKHDVVPGTYEVIWFEATKTGRFRLECTQYCGTGHARMGGEVVVQTPAAYAHWLADQGVSRSLADEGKALFRHYGCSGCHDSGSTVHAPSLVGLYGSLVHLQSGDRVRADERYIRDSILEPHAQIVAGYGPIMPSFANEIPEDDLMKLLAYIQSLSGPAGKAP